MPLYAIYNKKGKVVDIASEYEGLRDLMASIYPRNEYTYMPITTERAQMIRKELHLKRKELADKLRKKK
jgi:hypothetical protein